ncbi:ATP-binding protein [Ruegeria sp. 2012CJ41-6]|uniref:histidine kinase n=1 Tax=Ruegeria spongiae TaxID=2942209 RepID=A0ABT0PXP3_9RHOB|nr:ATP-binding protein [Ruegeria spongiae]MCL6282383.1 ATP-binding protein [Ruegeria spongiae]
MSHTRSSRTDQLSGFETRYSRRGLLRRYARWRIANFGIRQFVTITGGIALAVTNGPASGLIAVLAALIGEAVDCLYLRSLPVPIPAGRGYRRVRQLSTLTAAFQALTIAFCVYIGWTGPVTGLSPFFAMAFLTGASIDAGLTMPYHRCASIVRLTIYGTTALALNIGAYLTGSANTAALVPNISAILLLAYMVLLFQGFVNQNFQRQRASTLELLRKSRRLARRQREAQQLSLVARNANDSVLLSDARGRITWVNDAFTRITGYTPQEAIGNYPGDLLNAPETDPDTLERLASAIAAGTKFRGEILNATKTGQLIWVEINLVPVKAQNGRVEMWVAVERDVTAARAHAREMTAAREAAERGARAKAEFLATMSHELRTPLNGVIGMADVLLDSELDADQRENALTIRSSARALLTIINDILDLSKLEARKTVLRPVRFDLQSCLRESTQLLTPQARTKDLQLTFKALTPVPPLVLGDEGRLRQILINLIGNALKFTAKGRVGVTLSVAARDDGHAVTIEVSDTGIGIAPDKLDHVFDRFSQADADINRTHGGTGLGLTISKELVEAMGGSISVTSELGRGTCFRITLPFGFASQARLPEGNVDPGPCLELDGMRLLVADDNKVNRLLISKFLKDVPLNLEFAHDGAQAVEAVQRNPPDLILMDVAMPVMSGLEAARMIRAGDGAQPRIIALTANTFDSDRAACDAAGMDDFLSKPIRRSDLMERLTHYARASASARRAGH